MASPRRCLFIDDDADDQEFFCDAALSIDPQIECIFADNGIEAMTKLNDSAFTPDFIFIDMNMPQMNGRETLSEIRKMDRLNMAAVYMYSTAAAPRITEEIMALGATDFLIKPSSVKGLQEMLGKILK
ncbi:response regulator [Flavobacterium sp. MAH-1]|uniref:Response regulator n=1 Tax=Flavobacterium agri TaxID=2743471 RepID=A0A7Y8XZ76_9FLAO|nr:response regulator [Flavobacterium agri]NUY79480.1 response regulator [Flavobacterium agri]NYA69505.1 response regulator [Flavobacterium agri]